MGGNAWGGHFDCPGKPIIAERAAIIARAQALDAEHLANEPSHPPLADMAKHLQSP